ncbi:MAG: VWA domain-containing protein [Planctomycetes bacterium]|nr:VWA domain-containing protein [Planctomycetota bacterium]
MKHTPRHLATLAVAALLNLSAPAQSPVAPPPPTWPELSSVSHVVVPQARGFALAPGRTPILVDAVAAEVELLDQAARTTLDVLLTNPGTSRAEAVLLLPVPAGAVVSAFEFEGSAAEPTARLLPRDEARRTYDEIVARVKDPALLEFAGANLVRSSVFPVEAGGRQRVRLTYEHLLPIDGGRVDYVLPRSESLSTRVPWHVKVDVASSAPISMVYSPTHDVEVLRREAKHLALRVRPAAEAAPGPFRLSYLLERDDVTASLVAYPAPEIGGGYFLVMAGLPATLEGRKHQLKREVTIVLDRSGSMAGEKMDQARAAALQVIEGLAPGEAFNVIDYSSRVSKFAAQPVLKSREEVLAARAYLDTLRPTGGTNIHDALLEALRQPAREGYLGIVLFLTDGLPTVGQTSERSIEALVHAGNVHGRRVFTFGVGLDVNAPLLDRLADETRAVASYVLPGEDVELSVAGVFEKLYGPVLSDLELETLDASGQLTTRAVREVLPARLPDLYEGDQLVLLGQYLGEAPLRFRLKGDFLGTPRTFAFEFGVEGASTRNAFVPRLWAGRKIAFLVDRIRQAGAELGANPIAVGTDLFTDPRYAELAEEILRLSTEFGILSEYTSFLATEGTDLGHWGGLLTACNAELDKRAVRLRVGAGAVSQSRNFNEKKAQTLLNYDNDFWDEQNRLVSTSNVQQICDRAFFQRDGRWIDSRLIGGDGEVAPAEVVTFGSAEHTAMVDALASQGRSGLLSLSGDILLDYQGRHVLVKNGAGE